MNKPPPPPTVRKYEANPPQNKVTRGTCFWSTPSVPANTGIVGGSLRTSVPRGMHWLTDFVTYDDQLNATMITLHPHGEPDNQMTIRLVDLMTLGFTQAKASTYRHELTEL